MAVGRVAGAASFLLVAETGEFNADVSAAERHWAEGVAGMSEQTLRLDAAQQRLRRTLARFPADSEQVKRATLSLKNAQREQTTQTVAQSRAMETSGRASRAFGSAMRFATTALIGGAGLAYGLRAVIKAATDNQVALAQTRNAVRNAGISWNTYAKQVDQATTAQSNLTGFTHTQTLSSFALLVRATKDVNAALKLNALAADVARGRNLSLQQASLLLVRVYAGQVGSLRRLGIEVQKGVTGTQALALVQKQFAGQAASYGRTTAGAQARLNVELHNTEVLIGNALLPTLSHYTRSLADWLGKAKNQQKLQHDVNVAVKDGTQAIKGLVTGVKALDSVVGPLVAGLGGIKTATELAFGLWVITRLRGIAAGLGLVRATALTTAASFDTLAASEAAAGSAGGGGGIVGGLGGPLAIAGAAIVGSALYNRGKNSQNKAKWDALTPQQQRQALASLPPDKQNFILHTVGWKLKPLPAGKAPTLIDKIPAVPGGISPRSTSSPILSATLPSALTLGEAKASALYGPDSSQERAQLELEKAYLKRALADKRQTAADQTTLWNALAAVNSQLESIQNKGLEAEKKHQSKLDKARKAALAEKKREVAQSYKDWLNVDKVALGVSSTMRSPLGRTKVARTGKSSAPFDWSRFFLEQQSTFFGSFGSNVFTENQAGRRSPGTIVVNHNYASGPTTDMAREARLSRFAYQAAFD